MAGKAGKAGKVERRVRVAIHLDKSQAEKLEAIGKQNGGTVAGIIRLAVDSWLEVYEKRAARLAELEQEETRQALLYKLQQQQDALKKAGE